MTHRILQVIPEMYIGGAERTTVEVAKALVDAHHEAYIATLGGPLADQAEAAGARLFARDVKSKNPVMIWRNTQWMRRLIQEYNIDLIHARSRAPAWSAYWAAKAEGIPYLATYHGTYKAQGALKRAYNAIMTKGQLTIANSGFIKDHIIAEHGLDPDRIVVIPRGANTEQFDPQALSPDRLQALKSAWGLHDLPGLVLLLPARLTPWKGQSLLLEALAQVQFPFTALLVGEDQGRHEYTAELRRTRDRLGLGDRVHLVGGCQDMPAAYGLCDVVVSPSTEPEAFGRVAIEAMAMGKPIVASDHGGHRETILSGRTGILHAPGDVHALAQALDQVAQMPQESRDQMGMMGRQHVVDHFSTQAMTKATLSVYDRLLKRSP